MNNAEVDQFWRDYEQKIGEKVVKFALGRYLSGWAEFEGPLWGLAIVTEGGFRFHHFPHESWITALSRLGGGGGVAPTEKTLFIPRPRIRSYELIVEKSWIRRLLTPSAPQIKLVYDREGDAAEPAYLFVELDRGTAELEAALKGLVTA